MRSFYKGKVLSLQNFVSITQQHESNIHDLVKLELLKLHRRKFSVMGVPTDLWRARIGGYLYLDVSDIFDIRHQARARHSMAAINVHSKRPGVHLLLAFVMLYIVLPHACPPQHMCTLESKDLLSLWETFHDACIAQLPFETRRPLRERKTPPAHTFSWIRTDLGTGEY